MPASRTARYSAVEQPYPGLRPFDVKDAFLFFGREQHTRELLERLSRNRFLAVVGTSGSGKSSLVRAGLMPALYRGYLVGATTRWRIAVMRPGSGPLDEMAQAIAAKEALGGDAAEIRARLENSSLGLVSVVRNAELAPGESLLLVVDQFEELFRFATESRSMDSSGEARLFVSSLLEAVDQFEVPIYVVLTMRTDFLGDCTLFPGLPEALNRSQYLIPRLSREQRRDAIERPVEIAGAEIAPRLVQQILNDMGDDPDQLPVMQHAMARMYRLWKAKGRDTPLDLDDYSDAGAIAAALNDHAQSIYDGFDDAGKEWTRKLFRALTKMDRGREVRRPGRLDRILRIVGAQNDADRAAVLRVIESFASEGNSLLFVSPGEKAEHRVVDISHESLIRKWKLLGLWVKEEAESAEWFSDLLRDTRRKARGDADYWAEPHLGTVLRRKAKDGWTPAWGEQYSGGAASAFADVETFLDHSQARERKRKQIRYSGYAAIAVVLLGGLVTAEMVRDANTAAREAVKDANAAKSDAEKARQSEKEAVSNAQKANAELQELRRVREEGTKQVENLKNSLQAATTDAEKLRYQTQINTANAKILDSLQKENKDLLARVSEVSAKAQSAKPDESAELRAKVDQLQKDLQAQAQSYEQKLASAVKPQAVDTQAPTQARRAQTQYAQQAQMQAAPSPQYAQQGQQMQAAPTQNAAPAQMQAPPRKRTPVRLESDSGVVVPDTGILFIADFHDVLTFAKVWAITGSGSGFETFSHDPKSAKKVLDVVKNFPCDGSRTKVQDYTISCFTVSPGSVKPKEGKSLHTVVEGIGGRSYDVFVQGLNIPVSKKDRMWVDLEVVPIRLGAPQFPPTTPVRRRAAG